MSQQRNILQRMEEVASPCHPRSFYNFVMVLCLFQILAVGKSPSIHSVNKSQWNRNSSDHTQQGIFFAEVVWKSFRINGLLHKSTLTDQSKYNPVSCGEFCFLEIPHYSNKNPNFQQKKHETYKETGSLFNQRNSIKFQKPFLKKPRHQTYQTNT